MKRLSLWGLLAISILSVACTGGRNRTNRDGYCFNDAKTGTYDPIPLKFEHDNYRKASFSIQPQGDSKAQSLKDKEDALILGNGDLAEVQEVAQFSPPTYGGPDLEEKIKKSEEERLRKEENRRKEFAKIYPIDVGTYEYVSAEIYISEFLPQKVSQNKYRRIHLTHSKSKKAGYVFSNNCVSNLPYNDSLPAMTLEGLTGFKVLNNGEILTDQLSTYTVEFKDWKIISKYSANNKNVPSSPKEYLKNSSLNYQLYKIVNPKNMEYTHELRTKGKTGKADYYITVRLNYLSPKALEKREAERKKKAQENKESVK